MTVRAKKITAHNVETPTQRGARRVIELWALTDDKKDLRPYTLDPRVRGKRQPRNLLVETIEALPEAERAGALWVFSEIVAVALDGFIADIDYLQKVIAHIPEDETPQRALPARRPLARQ